MNSRKSNLVLLLTAAIWGFAFVAQRIGMDYIGPFMFNSIRFALGSFSLLPVIFFLDNRASKSRTPSTSGWKDALLPGLTAGIVIFIAASLQQVGLVYTEAGKAAFLTGLYIVFVPIIQMVILNDRLPKAALLGTVTATIGLYLLSVKDGFTIARGDLMELIGAFFWAVHILVIDRFVKSVDTLKLAFFQFITCSFLCLATAVAIESTTLAAISQALIPLLYGGICSVGIAYTLQLVGQENAVPSHAAIILSMETLFAAIGGLWILNEQLAGWELVGCGLMFAGMLISQLGTSKVAGNNQDIDSSPEYGIEHGNTIKRGH